MRRTKADAQLTRAALLDAAELLFAERGVSRTSLQDIAKAAGVTRGAVYWHFADKAELFNAMMARATQPMLDALQAIDPATEADPLQALTASTRAALHQIAHHAPTRRVFDVAIHKVEYVDDLLGVRQRHLSDRRACLSDIAAAFAEARARGLLPAHSDPAVLATGYHALVSGLIQNWLLEPTDFDMDAVAEVTLRTYLRGLGAP